MPLNYGSVLELPKIKSSEFGKVINHNNAFSWTTFFRTLITIAEIGLAFTGVGIIADAAIGLGAGAANEILDYTEGNLNVTGSLLNFAAPFVSGGWAGLKNIGNVGKMGKGLDLSMGFLENQNSQSKILLNTISKHHDLDIFKFLPGHHSQAYDLTKNLMGKYKNLSSNLSRFEKFNKGLSTSQLKNYKEMGKGFLSLGRDKIIKAGILNSDNAAEAIHGSINEKTYLNGLLNDIGLSAGQISNFLIFAERRGFKNLAMRDLTGEHIRDLVGYFAKLEKTTATTVVFKEFNKQLNIGWKAFEKSGFDLFKDEMRLSNLIATIRRFTNKYGEKALNKEMNVAAKVALVKAMAKESKKFSRQLKYLFKNPQSKRFNDWIVQKLQLIDPNDAGRAAVEWLYGKIKNKIKSYFKKFLKFDKLEEAFERSGGTLINSSWIMGIKVLPFPHISPSERMIVVTFRPGPSNNKRPVIIRTSALMLERFITSSSPGAFYLRHYALSRGGKKVSMMGMFGKGVGKGNTWWLKNFTLISKSPIMAVLPLSWGHFNINALKNILSIVSNYVENGSDMAKGSYLDNWSGKFWKSMRNSAISRTFRLASIALGAGIGVKLGHKIGKFLQKETQRIGTQIIARGIKNTIAGKSFSNGLGRATISGVLTSVRSHSLSKLRYRHPNSGVVKLFSLQRKLKQVNRIPNAIVPGRPYRGIRLQGNKKKGPYKG